ncbi:MAG: hypothetical protein WC701_14550 [Kiritimatiellales bacterium]|jgi:hypothetical protein
MIDDRLVGDWKCEDDDCFVRISISKDGSGHVQIGAVDLSDNEVLTVLNVKETSRALSFDFVVPSSGYQTKSKFVLQPDGSCMHQLTMLERWVKAE